jgi:arylsulfatase A-like enzyme
MAAMLSAMDDAVGTVLERLRACGVEDDTLIFFISDNGGPTRTNASRNTPFSGYKGELWEGGIRVPFLVQWKRHLSRGQIIHWPVCSLDIAATALAAAGATPQQEHDGIDLSPLAEFQSRSLYWRYGDQAAVRRGDHKLIMLPDREPRLFDLGRDPGEKNDLANEHPQIVRELRDDFDRWNAQLVQPKWQRSAGRRSRSRRRRANRPPTTAASRPDMVR